MPLSIPQQLSELLKSYKAKAVDGLTVSEGVALVKEATAAMMAIVAVLNEPGEEKKALVLSYVGELVDFLLPKLVAVLPIWARFFAPYFVPLVKQAILALAESWLEKTYLEKFKVAK